MTDYICAKKLYEDHGKPNRCNCFNCRDEKGREAALEFYRQNMGPGAVFDEPFPEKENEKA